MKLNTQACAELEKVDNYLFNIFNVKKHTNDCELETVITYIFAKEGIFDSVPISKKKFLGFLQQIASMYKSITYHNKTHAADLAQTFYHYCTAGQMAQKCDVDQFELMTYVLAAACHDVEHPGFSNVYLIETRHNLALRYNDKSVLENHHLATTFDVLKMDANKYDIFEQFDRDQYKRMRSIMIGAILSTDMSDHF